MSKPKRPVPTPVELRELLDYDPDTGVLTWKARPLHWFSDEKGKALSGMESWNRTYAGKQAFTTISEGYFTGSLQHRVQKAHRVIWAMVHGEWPRQLIDHINGDRGDNRITNLRMVDFIGNAINRRTRWDNKTGHPGVYPARRGRWMARIHVRGKQVALGEYATREEAIAVRKRAEAQHGYTVRNGKK